MTLARQIKELALDLGFDAAGIASTEPFTTHEAVTLSRFQQGLLAGMPWFTPERVQRGSYPQRLLPGARSIISIALNYYTQAPVALDGTQPLGRVSRYAWGLDYHRIIDQKLAVFLQGLRAIAPGDMQHRTYVDTGPMLDRAAAQRAGVGWFGKNTNILTTTHGSWVFLAQVVLNTDLEPDAPLRKTCGSCTACIPACPTGAIVAPYVIDSTRCISYHTIENRRSIPREIRPLMGNWIFGCDLCQEVCPVNRKHQKPTGASAFQPRGPDMTTPSLVPLLRMSEDEFRERFRNSPVRRARYAGFLRNICVALGNAGDRGATHALAGALESPEPLVREHAAWALGRLGGSQARAALEQALHREEHPAVLAELRLGLEETLALA